MPEEKNNIFNQEWKDLGKENPWEKKNNTLNQE